MARTLSRGLAPVVEEMEVEQPELVTTAALEAIVERVGLRTPVRVVASRLKDQGWLLPTGQRGVWEFAPAAHGGPVGRNGVTTPLQAALKRRPDVRCGLTFQAAAWAHGLADRAPASLEIAVFDAGNVRALKGAGRVSTFHPVLPTVMLRGVPVLVVESVLVQMAERPGEVRSWASAREWLPDVAAEASWSRVMAELLGRPSGVRRRLGYLLSGVRPDLAKQLQVKEKPTRDGRWVLFGSADEPYRRDDAVWRVHDSLLPFDPGNLPHVGP